ncbi:TRAP transporter small permease subunit [Rhizobiaceae bacterium]|nr:TRAP transporter small permease subunit [Rhizobiaceae bacterium]
MTDAATSTLPMGHQPGDTVIHDGFGSPHAGDTISIITRLFGWAMLTMLVAWFLNRVLTLTYEWPGALRLFDGGGALSAVQAVFYVAALVVAAGIVFGTRDMPLRVDSLRISEFNKAVVRACFFIVLFVGIGDVIVSALRVEGVLGSIVGSDLERELGRSQFRGPWLHVPLAILGIVVSLFVRTLGFHWLTLMIVGAELLIVITRFVFSYEQAFMGDLVRFWYAALFLFASAFTLLEEGHVRVDIFYAGMANRSKGRVNTLGTLFLGIALCWTILIVGLGGKSSIVYGAVANFEVSQSGFGLYVKYFMAAFLAVFAVTMLIQFVSYLMESVADSRGDPGTRLDRGDVVAH